jgi:hypothetical protein
MRKACGGFGALGSIGEEPVAPADHKGKNGSLDGIVVDGQSAVTDTAHELRPLVVQIAKRLAELALGIDLGPRHIKPAADLIQQGDGLLNAQRATFFGFEVLGQDPDPIEPLNEVDGAFRDPWVNFLRIFSLQMMPVAAELWL